MSTPLCLQEALPLRPDASLCYCVVYRRQIVPRELQPSATRQTDQQYRIQYQQRKLLSQVSRHKPVQPDLPKVRRRAARRAARRRRGVVVGPADQHHSDLVGRALGDAAPQIAARRVPQAARAHALALQPEPRVPGGQRARRHAVATFGRRRRSQGRRASVARTRRTRRLGFCQSRADQQKTTRHARHTRNEP